MTARECVGELCETGAPCVHHMSLYLLEIADALRLTRDEIESVPPDEPDALAKLILAVLRHRQEST